mgnify:CR=1 FL=1
MLTATRHKSLAPLFQIGLPASLLGFGYLVSIVSGWTVIGLTTNGWESDPGIPQFVLEGIVIGAVISSFQWIVVRRKVGIGLLPFMLMSSAGLAVAWPVGELLADPAGWVVSFMIFGFEIGMAQLVSFRRVPIRGYIWVAMSTLAWMSSSLPVVTEALDFLLLLLIGAGLFGAVPKAENTQQPPDAR